MAVAKSLSRFRLTERSSFHLDAIAGALLVIALMQPRATCSAFQSQPSSWHLHLCSSCASTAICWKACRHVWATACINNDQRTTLTQLCLHYMWFNRDQPYINRKPDIAVSPLALYQQRTTG